MGIKQSTHRFTNDQGESLIGWYSATSNPPCCIVFLHGFPGTSQYIVSQRMEMLTVNGFDLFRFDFSGSGQSEGAFAEKRISKEVSDTRSAIDYIRSLHPHLPIVLVGHSTGAIVSALYGYTDRRIASMILLGGVSDLSYGVRYDFTDEQVAEMQTRGFIRYDRPGSWVDGKVLEKGYLDEFFTLNVLSTLRQFDRPCLIIHGKNDEIVSWLKDPQELFATAQEPKKLVGIEGADHKFTQEEHWCEVMKHISSFIFNDIGHPVAAFS